MKKKDWVELAKVGSKVVIVLDRCLIHGKAKSAEIYGTITEFIRPDFVVIKTSVKGYVYFKDIMLAVHRKQVDSIENLNT